MKKKKPEGVILLHGILRSSRSMAGLGKYLETKGYSILNINYSSTKNNLQTLADSIQPQIKAFTTKVCRCHFIGFSMGGLLIRVLLTKYRPNNLGRVVMLGTPNKGSEVADTLQNFWLYQKLYGPAGQQLITNQINLVQFMGKVNYELGIIAGSKSIDPISSYIIQQPNDGKVAIEKTKIDESKDHITLPISHTFMPINKEVWRQTLCFIQNGEFSRN